MKVKKSQYQKPMVQTRFLELLARKKRVENRDITYEDVASETGISKSSIQKWARNTLQRFDGKQILAFCEYFGCGISDLLILVDESEEDEDSSEGEYKEKLAA